MKKDTRTLKQVEKAVTTMRKRVAAAVKRHQEIQARLAKAIESVKVYEEMGFATVHSTTKANETYTVDFNKNFYATSCNCKAGQCKMDCIHQVAVCRALDDRRPSFYAGIRKLAKPVATYRQDGKTYNVAKVGSKLVTKEQEDKRVAFVQAFNPCLIA